MGCIGGLSEYSNCCCRSAGRFRRGLGPANVLARGIARIVQAKRQMCHRPGDIAPFALMTYDDAVAQGRAIRGAVTSRAMPPWKPVPGTAPSRATSA